MEEFDQDSLIAAMVGRKIESLYPDTKDRAPGDPLLSARGLRVRGTSEPVDLEIRAGEIVGIGGLLGSGRTELLRALFGADPVDGGEIEVGRTSASRRATPAGSCARAWGCSARTARSSGCCWS